MADNSIELFTGAPNRGHFPVTWEWLVSNSAKKQSKWDHNTISWEYWCQTLDEMSLDNVRRHRNLGWPFSNLAFHQGSTKAMHDRRHWHAGYHPSLEALLERMSQFTLKRPSRCQKKLKQQENDRHWAQYMRLKELFKLELNRSLKTWLQDNSKNLKTPGPDFWKKYQRFIVDRNKTLLGALKNYEEKLVSSAEERMEVLKRSFFTREHLLSQNFTETDRLQAAITKTRLLSKNALDEKLFSQRIRYTPWNRNRTEKS